MPDVEIMPRRTDRRGPEGFSYGFSHHAVTPGWLGKIAAALTFLTAAAVIAGLLFGKILFISAAATILWPMIFSAEFTRWIFGTATVPFWKILFIFTFMGFATRWIRGWMRD